MLTPMLAEMSGSIHVGLAGLGSAIGVGLVGMKASEAVGRNPGAFGKVIVLAVLVLEERRQRIAEGLENAEKIKAELAQTEASRKGHF
jgi:F-type H+-transporting ATPase subunit c